MAAPPSSLGLQHRIGPSTVGTGPYGARPKWLAGLAQLGLSLAAWYYGTGSRHAAWPLLTSSSIQVLMVLGVHPSTRSMWAGVGSHLGVAYPSTSCSLY